MWDGLEGTMPRDKIDSQKRKCLPKDPRIVRIHDYPFKVSELGSLLTVRTGERPRVARIMASASLVIVVDFHEFTTWV
jgi:hypothetical protein